MVAACLTAYGRIDVLDNMSASPDGSVVDVSEAGVGPRLRGQTSRARPRMSTSFLSCAAGRRLDHQTSRRSLRSGIPALSYVTYAATKAADEPDDAHHGGRIPPQHVRVKRGTAGPDEDADGSSIRGAGVELRQRPDVEAMWRARDAQVPMGTWGTWDVANAALFLRSDDSKYVTGIELVVDGGITLKMS